MKETRKLKILTKAEGKYKTYSLDQLAYEAQLLEAKLDDAKDNQFRLNNRIDKWENEKFHADIYPTKKGIPSLIGTTILLTVGAKAAVAITTQDTGATLVSCLVFGMGSALIGLGNVEANVHKPVSLPIARAYNRFLGDKIEMLGQKKLMVDELMETKRAQYENDIAHMADLLDHYANLLDESDKNSSIDVYATDAKNYPQENEEENTKIRIIL